MTRGITALLLAGLVSLALFTRAGATTLSPLHARGTQIFNASGQPVMLRGVNLGGWLVEEPWMQPLVTNPPAGSGFAPIKDHVSLWGTLKKRLGTGGMQRVRTAFRDAWITEADFNRIHDAGLNCVRLPFLASLLDEPDGTQWLDRAVTWAGAHGVYVILDLHGVPGGQSDQGHTGQADVNAFFKTPADIASTAALWTRLAHHFNGNPTVAGYDLLNEPTGTPNSDTLYVVTDRLYRAVRAADTRHLIFIEDGYTGVQWMPFPQAANWQNVVYSSHYYHFDAKTADDQQKATDDYLASVEKERDRHQVPFYVGEFGLEPHGTPAILASFTGAMTAKDLSWSLWTYKVMWAGGGSSLWAIYSNPAPVVPLDPYHDSEAELIRKCGEFRTERLSENAGMVSAFRKVPQLSAP